MNITNEIKEFLVTEENTRGKKDLKGERLTNCPKFSEKARNGD